MSVRSSFALLCDAVLICILSSCAAQPQQSSEVDLSGCHLDLKKICQAFLDQPELYVNGQRLNVHTVEQNSTRHLELLLPLRYPDGGTAASARCNYDMLHKKVAWGTMGEGPPLTDRAIEYIRSRGFCTGDYAKILQAVAQQEERELKAVTGER